MENDAFKQLESELLKKFNVLQSIQEEIVEILKNYSNGKVLKGNEIVGCLGEIYTKMIFGGFLVDDSNEHDVETKEGLKISVKTRKGRNSGWKQTSIIPKINGENTPTDLVFVNLRKDYTVNKIWRYKWSDLIEKNRFREKYVRGTFRGYYILVDEKGDIKNCIYDHNQDYE